MTNYDNEVQEGSGEPWRDKQKLREMYSERGLSPAEIAVEWGCSYRTIKRWIDRHGIGDYECDTCGNVFGSKRGRNAHSARVHGINIEGREELVCEICGETYPEYPSRVDRSRYCSEECNHIGTGIDAKERASHTTGVCVICGDDFPTYPSHIDSRRTCGRECDAIRRSKWTGEDSHSWKGGWKGYYGPSWKSQRRRARERDDYRCQDPACDVTNEDHLERYGEALHVHHIVRFWDFDDSEKANRLSNLVTLCRDCHLGKWEQLPGLRPDNT